MLVFQYWKLFHEEKDMLCLILVAVQIEENDKEIHNTHFPICNYFAFQFVEVSELELSKSIAHPPELSLSLSDKVT